MDKIIKKKKGGAAGERNRKKVKLNEVAKFCHNIQDLFNKQPVTNNNDENDEKIDDPDPVFCSVRLNFITKYVVFNKY